MTIVINNVIELAVKNLYGEPVTVASLTAVMTNIFGCNFNQRLTHGHIVNFVEMASERGLDMSGDCYTIGSSKDTYYITTRGIVKMLQTVVTKGESFEQMQKLKEIVRNVNPETIDRLYGINAYFKSLDETGIGMQSDYKYDSEVIEPVAVESVTYKELYEQERQKVESLQARIKNTKWHRRGVIASQQKHIEVLQEERSNVASAYAEAVTKADTLNKEVNQQAEWLAIRGSQITELNVKNTQLNEDLAAANDEIKALKQKLRVTRKLSRGKSRANKRLNVQNELLNEAVNELQEADNANRRTIEHTQKQDAEKEKGLIAVRNSEEYWMRRAMELETRAKELDKRAYSLDLELQKNKVFGLRGEQGEPQPREEIIQELRRDLHEANEELTKANAHLKIYREETFLCRLFAPHKNRDEGNDKTPPHAL